MIRQHILTLRNEIDKQWLEKKRFKIKFESRSNYKQLFNYKVHSHVILLIFHYLQQPRLITSSTIKEYTKT